MARRLLAALLLLVPAAGCVLPAQGTRVFVDRRAGRFWNGEGMLLEVSADQKRCLVAIRDMGLVVHERWVDCQHDHALSVRDQAPSSSSLR